MLLARSSIGKIAKISNGALVVSKNRYSGYSARSGSAFSIAYESVQAPTLRPFSRFSLPSDDGN